MKQKLCVLLLLSFISGGLFAQAPVLEKQIRTLYKNGLAKLDSPYVKKAFIGTGLSLVGDTLKCTITSGTGTVTSVNATAPAAGFTVSGVPITTSGTMVFALSDDLAALEAMSSTGLVSRTAANTYANRTITGGTGISISNGDGVSGNPTITNTGDLSDTNEAQTLSAGGSTSPTINLTAAGGAGGGTVTLSPAGIMSFSRTGNTITATATEADGSATNEGLLGVGAGSGTSSVLLSNTSGATGVTINAAGTLTITETTSANGGSITLTGAGGSNWTVSGADIYRNSNVSVGTTTVGTAKFLVNGVASSVCGLFGAGTGLATGAAVLRATGTATTASYVYALDGDISVSGGNLIGRIRNGATTGASGAIMNVSVGGANVNDPILQLQIEGQNTWAVGVDNSNSDRFTISASATPGTSDMVNINTTGEMGVSTAPVADLSVAYGLQKPLGLPSGPTANRSTGAQGAIWNNSTTSRVEGKTSVGIYKSLWSDATPSFTIGPASGTGASGSVSGNEMCGSVTWTTGTSTTSGVLFTITYPVTFLGGAIVVISPKSSATAGQLTNLYIANSSGNFTVSAVAAQATGTVYQINYQIQQ